MIGLALYGLASIYQLVSSDPIIKRTKKCKYCRQKINEKVSLAYVTLPSDSRLIADRLDDASTARAGSMDEKSAATDCLPAALHDVSRHYIPKSLYWSF